MGRHHEGKGRYSAAHLLRRHVKGDRPEVDLLVRVNARHDEEEAGALGAAGPQPPEPEHHGSLVLLHDLKGRERISLLGVAAVRARGHWREAFGGIIFSCGRRAV